MRIVPGLDALLSGRWPRRPAVQQFGIEQGTVRDALFERLLVAVVEPVAPHREILHIQRRGHAYLGPEPGDRLHRPLGGWQEVNLGLETVGIACVGEQLLSLVRIVPVALNIRVIPEAVAPRIWPLRSVPAPS